MSHQLSNLNSKTVESFIIQNSTENLKWCLQLK